MTKDQISRLRESYMKQSTRPDGSKSTLGEYMRFVIDGPSIDFATSKDFVVFDDGAELLHCVSINEDMKSQCTYPIKAYSAAYSDVRIVESVFSTENFIKLLDEGFMKDLLSDDKKEFMKTWAKNNIRNQAQQPMDATPFYNTKPNIVPMHDTSIIRDDKITDPIIKTSLTSVKVTNVDSADALSQALEECADGEVIIASGISITDDIEINKSIHLILDKGSTIEGDVTVNADNVSVVGIYETPDKDLFTVNGSNFVLK